MIFQLIDFKDLIFNFINLYHFNSILLIINFFNFLVFHITIYLYIDILSLQNHFFNPEFII